MNSKERQKYLRQHIQLSGKFFRKYLPKIKKQLFNVQSSLIADIKANGLQRAMSNLSMTIASPELATVLQSLHKDVGLRYANINYRLLRAEQGRKFLGRDDIWINDIKNYLLRHLLEKAVIRVHETARNKLLAILQKAMDDGTGEFEILNIISRNGLLLDNAQRIVRTEINIASNAGLFVSAKQFDMVMEKHWIAHRDFRTRGRNGEDRKDHYHMDGQTVGLHDMFIEPKTGEQVLHPCDPKGSKGMIINCRCTYVTVAKRDENGRILMN